MTGKMRFAHLGADCSRIGDKLQEIALLEKGALKPLSERQRQGIMTVVSLKRFKNKIPQHAFPFYGNMIV